MKKKTPSQQLTRALRQVRLAIAAWESTQAVLVARDRKLRRRTQRYQTTKDLLPGRLERARALAESAEALANIVELEIVDLP